ncbi:MAG: extracellular solute-binding protein [Bifidobacteriaceae bacterium]|jgi:ABC-type glycerol-3-phosphate transport system substrate-binding protein|nr:extracellular solute-binding protein [Bifidobacteriaceae bacterium]
MKSTRTLVSVLVSGALLAGGLAGCAPGAKEPAAGQSAKQAVSKDLGSEEITLSLVTTPESGAPLEKIVAAFNKLHPNVTIEVQKTTFDDYNKGLGLQLASDSSPDIALLNMMGNYAKNGQVINLNDYAELYGWNDVFASNLLAQWRTDKDFKRLGGDTLYAVPTSLTLVGLYYNKELAKKAGVTEPPKTIEEFQAAMDKAKAAGVLPLQMGNSQGHASFLVQGVGQSMDGADAANDWALGKAGATFATKGNTAGAQLLSDLAAKEYLPASANGSDLQTGVGAFASGEGLFFNDGNWDAATIGEAMGDNVGFFAFPGDKATAIGGAIAYAISSKSKHPDAAAAFLDFMHTDEAAEAQFEAGFLPVNVEAIKPAPGLQSDIVEAYAQVNRDNGLVAYNNNVTPSMNDTLIAQTQELIAGRIDVPKFMAAIQADWAGALE